MARRLALALVAAAVLAAPAAADAATYYVSSTGSDAAAGTAAEPWRTVGKVNGTSFAAGDTVLFRGGDTFTDATLMPRTSGAAGAPITFGSYGSGRATISNAAGAVWFAGKRWLVFDGLTLSAANAARNVFAGSASAGSTDITIRDSVIENSSAVGIIAPTAADTRWSILNNTIRHIGDSGLILLSPATRVEGNTIVDTGWNTSIPHAKHGIYAKARDLTIAHNDISRAANGQAVSIRFAGARVYGNRIHDTGYAFAFFDYDTGTAGTSYIYDNTVWNLDGYAFYYSNQLDPNGAPPSVDFVIASNTFALTGGEAINVSESGSARVTIRNNVFTGSYGSALRKAPTTVSGHNLWHGAGWNVPSDPGDVKAAPALSAAPTLAPLSGSPVIDAGTTSVPSLTYSPACDGMPLSYCASAPEMGAVEAASAPAPLGAPTGLAATSVAQTAVTLGWAPSSDSRVVSYRVFRDGALVATTSATVATVSGLGCGTGYGFTVRGADSAGTLSGAASAAVATLACSTSPPPVADTTRPYVVFSNPKANAKVALSFTAAVTATDAGGVRDVVFYLGSRPVCTDAAAPFTCRYSVTVGSQRLQARATDNAGNEGWVSVYVSGSKAVRVTSAVRTTAAQKKAAKVAAARKAKAAALRKAKARAAARAAALRTARR